MERKKEQEKGRLYTSELEIPERLINLQKRLQYVCGEISKDDSRGFRYERIYELLKGDLSREGSEVEQEEWYYTEDATKDRVLRFLLSDGTFVRLSLTNTGPGGLFGYENYCGVQLSASSYDERTIPHIQKMVFDSLRKTKTSLKRKLTKRVRKKVEYLEKEIEDLEKA